MTHMHPTPEYEITKKKRRTRRLFCAGLAALALVLPVSPPAAGQGDNTAVAINTRDGSSIFRLAFKISRVMSDTVDQGNAAVAYASCESCETVAVAIQVVLIFSDPEVVSPENVALAVNSECSLCVTIAEAYQFVYGTGGPVHFDAEGNREIADIRLGVIKLLRSEGLSIEEFQSQLDSLMQRLKVVVKEHLVPAGRSGEKVDETAATEDAPTTGPDDASSPSPTPTGSGESETPSPSPSPSATTSGEDTSSTSTDQPPSSPSP